MNINAKILKLIYLRGLRRDVVADQLGITTKVLRVIEREELKKIVSLHFKTDKLPNE